MHSEPNLHEPSVCVRAILPSAPGDHDWWDFGALSGKAVVAPYSLILQPSIATQWQTLKDECIASV